MGARRLIRRAASCGRDHAPSGFDGMDIRQAGGFLPFIVGFHPGEQGRRHRNVGPVRYLVSLRHFSCRRSRAWQGRHFLLSGRQRRDLAPRRCPVVRVGRHSIRRRHCRRRHRGLASRGNRESNRIDRPCRRDRQLRSRHPDRSATSVRQRPRLPNHLSRTAVAASSRRGHDLVIRGSYDSSSSRTCS
jgi:hypothetical protein